MTYTVLGPTGRSRPPWGSFAGKAKQTGIIFTVMGPAGRMQPPNGSYANKIPSTNTSAAEWIVRARRRLRR